MTNREFIDNLFLGLDYVDYANQEWFDGEAVCRRLHLSPCYLALLEDEIEVVRLIDFSDRHDDEVNGMVKEAEALSEDERLKWVDANGISRSFVNLLGLTRLIDWSESEFSHHLQLSYRMSKMGCLDN